MKHEHMIQFRAKQLVALVKLSCALFISLFYKKKELWLVCERGTDARDNGYWFFLYVKSKHPEIPVYYIISSDSEDRIRLKDYEESLIDYRSMKHYVLLWRATHLVSTHIQGYFSYAGLGLWMKKICPLYGKKKHISLRHGITLTHIAFLDYANTHLDLLISGMKAEHDSFVTDYGYPADHVALTGLCRYDALNDYQVKNQILVMPTWREWLYKHDEFPHSEYVQRYISLLNNPQLSSLLDQWDMELVFYPHYEVQKHISLFEQSCKGPRIQIARKELYDVQQLLKESKLLITDYSSVFCDFAYMRKPVLFYQFDEEAYYKYHYAKGWFDFHHGFGPVIYEERDLVGKIAESLSSDCQIENRYLSRINECFTYSDSDNCKRVFEAIHRLT